MKDNISRKKLMMKFMFGIPRNIKVLCKLIVLFWVCVARHAYKVPKIKSVNTLHYLLKKH